MGHDGPLCLSERVFLNLYPFANNSRQPFVNVFFSM